MKEAIQAQRAALPEEVQAWLNIVDKAGVNTFFFWQAILTELSGFSDKEAHQKIVAINLETVSKIQAATATFTLVFKLSNIVQEWQAAITEVITGYTPEALAPPTQVAA